MAKKNTKSNLAAYLVIATLVVAVPLTVWGVNTSHQIQQSAAGPQSTVVSQDANDIQSYPPSNDPNDFLQATPIDNSSSHIRRSGGSNGPEYDSWYDPGGESYFGFNGNFTYPFNSNNLYFDYTYDSKNHTVKYRPLYANWLHQCMPNVYGSTTVGGLAAPGWSAKVSSFSHYYLNNHSGLVFWCDIDFYYKGAFKYRVFPRARVYWNESNLRVEGYQ